MESLVVLRAKGFKVMFNELKSVLFSLYYMFSQSNVEIQAYSFFFLSFCWL